MGPSNEKEKSDPHTTIVIKQQKDSNNNHNLPHPELPLRTTFVSNRNYDKSLNTIHLRSVGQTSENPSKRSSLSISSSDNVPFSPDLANQDNSLTIHSSNLFLPNHILYLSDDDIELISSSQAKPFTPKPVPTIHKVRKFKTPSNGKLINEYILAAEIGRGSFGKVFICENILTDKHYVCTSLLPFSYIILFLSFPFSFFFNFFLTL